MFHLFFFHKPDPFSMNCLLPNQWTVSPSYL